MTLLITTLSPSLRAHCGGEGFGVGGAGPINTFPAFMLEKGRTAFALRLDQSILEDRSDQQLAEFTSAGSHHPHGVDDVQSTTLSVAHGFSDRFSLLARTSFVRQEDIRTGHLHRGLLTTEHEGDVEGAGDSSLLGVLRMSDLDAPTQLVALMGAKLATGSTGERVRGGGLASPDHQPGSGSTDPLLGMAASRSDGKVSYHGNFLYQPTGRGTQDTDLGDIFRYNLAVVRTYADAECPGKAWWDLMLELNGEHRDRVDEAGVIEENHGGTLILASPGARYHLTNGSSFFGSVGIPVVDAPNGVGQHADMRLTGGWSTSW